jgi:hypothetical protein
MGGGKKLAYVLRDSSVDGRCFESEGSACCNYASVGDAERGVGWNGEVSQTHSKLIYNYE